jgi:hypothetical protein
VDLIKDKYSYISIININFSQPLLWFCEEQKRPKELRAGSESEEVLSHFLDEGN